MNLRTSNLLLWSVIGLWCLLHIPGVLYGTQTVPLHQSYIGDEQSPVNGALHMLQNRSLLSFGESGVLYYGPVFSVFAIPPVLADFGAKFISGTARSALEYRDYLLYDWGGIVLGIHIEAVLLSLLALHAFFLIVRRGSGVTWPPILATALLAFNYYFFEYSHFFKHWVVVIPALLIQFATMLAVREDSSRLFSWALHVAAALIAAGVSYISLLSMVMWLPVLYEWLKRRDWAALWRFTLMSTLIAAGFVLIIFWYPHAFVRLLGFVGMGEVTGGLGGAQNPFLFAATSFGYYGTLLVFNHLFFIAAAFVMAAAMGMRRAYADSTIQAALLVAGINFFLFAPAAHHEGRYMLPVIVFLLLALGRLFVLYIESEKRRFTLLAGALLASGLLFHVIHVGGWIQQYAKGPKEEVMLQELLGRPEPILVIDSYILGVPHTNEAYRAYAEKSAKTDVNLYKALLATTPPEGVRTYDVYYASRDEVVANPGLLREYLTVVERFESRKRELNQFDFIDENITRIWYADELLPTYRIW